MADDLPPLDGGPMPGAPRVPPAPPRELLDAFVQGDPGSSAAGWRIEGPMLVGGDIPLAIRVAEATLVRVELADEFAALVAELERALGDAGLSRIEERTVLGHVIAIEMAGMRGSEWDLWAPSAQAGHEALKRQALGELADRIDPDEPARRARQQEFLEQIERGLWP